MIQRLFGWIVGRIVAAGGRTVIVYGNFTGTINMGDQIDEARRKLERERLLAKSRKLVEEPLREQLGGVPLCLTLEYCPDAVIGRSSPTALEAIRLPVGTTIGEVFQEQDQKLLLLGESGSGKTTALRTLALDLAMKVDEDPRRPIPLIFNLASWGTRRRRLADWLVDELGQAGPYDQNRERARAWVVDEQFLPLLAGLDEVALDHRDDCVRAINEFREARKWVRELAVTCSADDYEALRPNLLNLEAAVRVCPLGREQIEEYLTSRGLQGLRAVLADDPTLRAMAASPLTLSFMASAFEDEPEAELPAAGTIEERHDRLVAAYVDNRFRSEEGASYTQEQARQWLGWLATAVVERKQPAFYLDRLQPEWLPTPTARRWYRIVDRLGAALIVGGVFGLLFGLHFGARFGPELPLVGALVGVLVGGLLGGEGETLSGGRRAWTIARGAVSGFLVVGALAGLIAALVGGWGGGLVPIGIVLGAFVGALAGGLAGGPSVSARRVVLRGPLGWSPLLALRHAGGGLIIGVLFGMVFGLIGIRVGLIVMPGRTGPNDDPVIAAVIAMALTAFLFGLVLALGFGLLGGMVAGTVEANTHPNQAVRRSARRAAYVFGWTTVASTLAVVVLLTFIGGSPRPLENVPIAIQGGLLIGPILGILAALAYGGYACISHFALRLVLARSGVLPLNLVSFLEYAKRCELLSRVGGGYEFRPGLLRHFAHVRGLGT